MPGFALVSSVVVALCLALEGIRIATFGRSVFPFDLASLEVSLLVGLGCFGVFRLRQSAGKLAASGAKGRYFDLALALTTAACSAVFLWQVAMAPVEQQMGVVQKIFYLHVPSAYAMYLGFGAAAAYGLAYFVWKKPWTDAYAVAGAEVGLLFAGIVMITGPLWGRKAWGTYWTWDPRLTTTLMVAMIFASYVILRSSGEAGAAEKKFASALAAVGFAMVPVIHYSVRLWRGQHPQVITQGGGGLDPRMVLPLVLGFATTTLLFVLLVRVRARAEFLHDELAFLRDESETNE